ncbi:MAG: Gfo/Idh/MocA family protein [Streptosporangiaceae bacterium]
MDPGALTHDEHLIPHPPLVRLAAFPPSAPAISVLLVGAGRRGLDIHVPALLGNPAMRLGAVVDTPERAILLRSSAGPGVPVHHSVDDAVAAEAPDLALVATPHDSHVPLALSLLRHRIPTLLEKPPARTSHEFAQLRRASQHYATPLAVLRPFLYEIRRRQFIRLLRSVNLADVEIEIQADVPTWAGIGEWRRSKERAGGGVLIDLGYHYLDIVISCLGPPDVISANLGGRTSYGDVEDEATVDMQFHSRNINVAMAFRCGADLKRRGDITIASGQRVVYASGSNREARTEPPADAPSKAATWAIRRQLNSLLATGFLEGRGDWLPSLSGHAQVMSLLDELYAAAR